MTELLRTALVVVVAEAERVVSPWRSRYLRETVERGIPPHVTVLFPFVPADELDDDVLETLGALYTGEKAFAFILDRVETFPAHAWLAPEPTTSFRQLIASTRRRFPDLVPYGDETLDPVPHLTVAAADDPVELSRIAAALHRRLAPQLPIQAHADAVALLEEQHDGTWILRCSFPLGGTT